MDDNKKVEKKNFLSEIQQGMMPMSLWHYQMAGTNQDAKKESMALFGNDPFATPKPETKPMSSMWKMAQRMPTPWQAIRAWMAEAAARRQCPHRLHMQRKAWASMLSVQSM